MFKEISERSRFSFLLIFLIVLPVFRVMALKGEPPGFRWGNGYYYNIEAGEAVTFKNLEVKLLKLENHYNLMKVGEDTIWIKVARRSIPIVINGVRIFVADNIKVKALAKDTMIHGLLKKDAMICLSDADLPLLNPLQFTFPVSFNDGFAWNVLEDSYMYSYYKTNEKESFYCNYPGIGLNLNDEKRGKEHWLAAMENSRVIWIENYTGESDGPKSCVLLKSESEKDIYYVYDRVNSKSVILKKGQYLNAGDAIGTISAGSAEVDFHFAAIQSAIEPGIGEIHYNTINGFPQLFELYFRQGNPVFPDYTRGRIIFGLPGQLNGNQLNTQEFEDFSGKGWVTGKWNPSDKVEWVTRERMGNVRIGKIMFEGTPAQSRNPEDYFDYIISVRNGTYRIRAKAGDCNKPTWQKIEFEGINAGIKELDAGEFEWTNERIVRVHDGSLTLRIYVDGSNKTVAGISEIVFQQMN